MNWAMKLWDRTTGKPAVWSGSPSDGGVAAHVIQGTLNTLGYATGSVATSGNIALSGLTWKDNAAGASTLAALVALGARFVQLRSDQALAWTTTSQTPTGITGSGTLGFTMVANTPIWLDVRTLANVKFLNSSGSTAYFYAEAYA